MRLHHTGILLVGLLAACSAPQINTTRLGSADLVRMTDQMTASLLAEEELAQRGPDGPPWIVTLQRVHNQTNDIIPRRELWAFMARLRAQLAQTEALKQKNLLFVLPGPRVEELSERYPDIPMDRAEPTHALTATFYALTNVTRRMRSDMYVCAFQMVDISSGELVWEDKYEVKRAVVRNKFD